LGSGDGRWLVGLIKQGQLRMDELTGPTRSVVVRLGVVGTIGRAVAFAIAGALVLDAAVTFNARKSAGVDGALRTLADRPYGPWHLGVFGRRDHRCRFPRIAP